MEVRMVNLVYIDDSVDTMLDSYLDSNGLRLLEYGSSYKTITFEPSFSYTDLIENPIVCEANIVIIDSLLFENENARIKFTGEEVALLFRKYHPFIETILISQNDLGDKIAFVKKFYDRHSSDYRGYYDKVLAPEIQSAQQRVIQSKILASKIEKNDSLDLVIREKLVNSVNGLLDYDNLKKEDIDRVITAFKELEERINA